MRPNLITRLKEEWNNLDPVDPLRGLIADAIDALTQSAQQQEPVAFEAREIGEGDWFQVPLTEPKRIVGIIESAHMDYRWVSSPPNVPTARASKPWVGLTDDDLDGYTKSDVLMVRHFERVLFERNTQPCLEGLPEPIRTPPEKGTEYWTIGLGRWTWGGTTHDYSSLGNGIWRYETDVWEVHAAIRRALGIESNIAAVFQNRHEAKLRERNE